MSWLKKLQGKWGVGPVQVIIILIVFACNGFTVLFLKEPVLSIILPKEDRNWLFTIAYYVLILPIYNVILLVYGFLFGQFRFFWEFEKRTFSRMFGKKKAPK
ncbi:MAG: DUF6787 family protein [Bacteroidota bacterium]